MAKQKFNPARTAKLPAQPAAAAPVAPVLLSRDDLRTFFGITFSRAHLYRLVAAGEFPRPVALGPHAYSRKCWRRDEVEAWVAALQPAGWINNNTST